MGSIYRQDGKGRSKNWTLQYFVDGTRIIESSGTSNRKDAERELKRREGKIADGEPVETVRNTPAFTFDDAVAMYDNDMVVAGRSSRDTMLSSVRLHLAPVFGGRGARLDAITTDKVTGYTRARLDAGAKRATINLELRALGRMLKLALIAGKIKTRPHITVPDPKNARKGFFESDDFAAVRAHLPEWFSGAATFAYHTGWRLASEVVQLEWRHVDRKAGVIRLDPHESKNDEGRTFPYRIVPELDAVIETAYREHVAHAKAGRMIARLFHRDGVALSVDPIGSRRTGGLRGWVRKAWLRACRDAHVPGRIPHDFRRTAVRRLVRAGIPEGTAMKITGHKTRDVFERYNIVNEADLTRAVTQYAAAHPAVETGHGARLVNAT